MLSIVTTARAMSSVCTLCNLWSLWEVTKVNSSTNDAISIRWRAATNSNGFRFLLTHGQTVDIAQLRSSCHAATQHRYVQCILLNVVGVLSMIDTLRGDYLDEWCNIQSEQHWSKNGFLGHTVFTVKDERLLLTASTWHIDCLRCAMYELLLVYYYCPVYRAGPETAKVNLRRSVVDVSKLSNSDNRPIV